MLNQSKLWENQAIKRCVGDYFNKRKWTWEIWETSFHNWNDEGERWYCYLRARYYFKMRNLIKVKSWAWKFKVLTSRKGRTEEKTKTYQMNGRIWWLHSSWGRTDQFEFTSNANWWWDSRFEAEDWVIYQHVN